MMRQVVLIRWTAEATEQEKQAVAAELLRLSTSFPRIREIRLGADAGIRPDNFDFAVCVDFDSSEDYLAYRDDFRHQRVVNDVIRPVMAERAGAVFEFPDALPKRA
jgi:hypothetical protein